MLNGEELTIASEKRMKQMRGNDIAMIFEEPMTSLNPLFTIGSQLMDAMLIHKRGNKKQAIDMLKLVGLPRAE